MKRSKKLTVADIPHVGRGTPAGEWFRRYWIVVRNGAELQDIPQAVKVLGEESGVVSRSGGNDRLDRRRTARIAARRWSTATSKTVAFAVLTTVGCSTCGGQCLEMPAEPKDSKFPQKVKHLILSGARAGRLALRLSGTGPGRSAAVAEIQQRWRIPPGKDLWKRRGSTITTGSTSSRTAPTRRTFRSCTEPIPNDGTWRSWFFNFKEIPHFDAVETAYGMKVVSRKPGPTRRYRVRR